MIFFSVILLSIYFSFEKNFQEKLVKDFVDAFNNDLIVKKWSFHKYVKKRKIKDGKKILRHVISNVKNLIVKNESEEYRVLKKLINDTQTGSFDNASFFHFETFVIVKSLQRIYRIIENCQDVELPRTKEEMNDFHRKMVNPIDDKLKYPTHHDYDQFNRKVILFEYACIYNDIMCISKIVSKKYIDRDIICLIYTGFFSDEVLFIEKFFGKRIKFVIKYSRNLIDKILMGNRSYPICVLTSPYGITHTLRCSKPFIKEYFPNEYKKIEILEEIRDFDRENIRRIGGEQLNIDYVFNKTLIYDRTSMKLFIMLIHFYSIQNEVEYMYEFSRIGGFMYKVKCGKYDIKSQFKSYYLEKNVPERCNIETIHKFCFIIDYEKAYSVVKSVYTVDKPINTRVIKLSCGHILGFELIDEWFKMFPDLKCHICMIDVFILGSYDTDVYRCI